MGELTGGEATQARTRHVRVAQQGSEAFIEQRRPQEPAVMCRQEGRVAGARKHKEHEYEVWCYSNPEAPPL